ncbi:MAG: SPOR domain-containing protein [Crocinitomicaceae bacterium]|nr:SPOR domain-containing protein [Crocinitomicaceae bacterium]
MKLIVVFLFACVSYYAFGQNGEVEIIKDPRLESLVAKQGEITPPAINPQIEGYRIQLFFDSDRTQLNDARARFFSRYPKIDTYTTYNAPNFFLRAGDFRTRLEAEKVKSEIENQFPTSFIVKETINLPRLDKEL